ncbi:hypothetical protein BT96DRAFT_576556 [Gymnopus androsaceus JB14]|uniref:Uncharacterized protein n=1 Tax=Gymnopus androsaceus JB14 TaxID=1447944 RepID=A0A6A4HXB1_9AGAR|nr:hypothetical protein BT96DRAFT_576556 [Gymnopus androsaceus JB14]
MHCRLALVRSIVQLVLVVAMNVVAMNVARSWCLVVLGGESGPMTDDQWILTSQSLLFDADNS